ncbi:MAG: shikimate kinase [Acidimicrobiia bacterium]|jgi:shikimate kinase
MDRHLWLVGMMGAGKSSVGAALALRRGVPFYDTDDEVEAEAGCTIARLWMERGEAAFRDLEAQAVARVAAAPAGVVATGGGVVIDPSNVAAMRASGTVVWLTAPAAELYARVGETADRPLLSGGDGGERLADLLALRADRYREAADHTIDTTGRTTGDVVDEIEARWTPS